MKVEAQRNRAQRLGGLRKAVSSSIKIRPVVSHIFDSGKTIETYPRRLDAPQPLELRLVPAEFVRGKVFRPAFQPA